MVITYHFGIDNFWDIWETLVLEHSFDVFPALQKACSSECFYFFVVILQLKELYSHTFNIGIRTVKNYFALEEVPKLVQLGKSSCSIYEDLMEGKELAQVKLAYQKARYFGQQRLQMMQDFDILGLEGLFFFCTLLRVLK